MCDTAKGSEESVGHSTPFPDGAGRDRSDEMAWTALDVLRVDTISALSAVQS
jgi:hypothetical protein